MRNLFLFNVVAVVLGISIGSLLQVVFPHAVEPAPETAPPLVVTRHVVVLRDVLAKTDIAIKNGVDFATLKTLTLDLKAKAQAASGDLQARQRPFEASDVLSDTIKLWKLTFDCGQPKYCVFQYQDLMSRLSIWQGITKFTDEYKSTDFDSEPGKRKSLVDRALSRCTAALGTALSVLQAPQRAKEGGLNRVTEFTARP